MVSHTKIENIMKIRFYERALNSLIKYGLLI
jgi:hypothetical protein